MRAHRGRVVRRRERAGGARLGHTVHCWPGPLTLGLIPTPGLIRGLPLRAENDTGPKIPGTGARGLFRVRESWAPVLFTCGSDSQKKLHIRST